jgi:hypothetical protein
MIKALGGELVNDIRDCTHLIAKKVTRSIKFLSCLLKGLPILNNHWIEESFLSKMFLSMI